MEDSYSTHPLMDLHSCGETMDFNDHNITTEEEVFLEDGVHQNETAGEKSGRSLAAQVSESVNSKSNKKEQLELEQSLLKLEASTHPSKQQVKEIYPAVKNKKKKSAREQKYIFLCPTFGNRGKSIIMKECFVQLERLAVETRLQSQVKAEVVLESENCSGSDDKCINPIKVEEADTDSLAADIPEQTVPSPGGLEIATSTTLSPVEDPQRDEVHDRLFEHPIDYEFEPVSLEQVCQDAFSPSNDEEDDAGTESRHVEADNNNAKRVTDNAGSSSRGDDSKSKHGTQKKRKRKVKNGENKKQKAFEPVSRQRKANNNNSETKDSFGCLLCQKSFSEAAQLQQHVVKAHDVRLKSSKCTVCQKTANKRTLKRHITRHKHKVSGKVRISCNDCDMEFENVLAHQRHKRSQHQRFQCAVCNQAWRHIHDLKVHMRIHTGERPYSCSVCKKTFREKGKLTKHTRIHTGEKRFFCSVCQKGFGERDKMERHKASCGKKRRRKKKGQ